MDCGTALTTQASAPANALATVTTYDSVTTTLTYASGWTDIFTTIGESKGCPVTSCELRTSDCSNSLADTVNVYINSNRPWGLTAKRNNVNGWDAETFCYRCIGTA